MLGRPGLHGQKMVAAYGKGPGWQMFVGRARKCPPKKTHRYGPSSVARRAVTPPPLVAIEGPGRENRRKGTAPLQPDAARSATSPQPEVIARTLDRA